MLSAMLCVVCCVLCYNMLQLAKAAGLELGAHGGIKVDGHMRTSDPAIYAVGEYCVSYCQATASAFCCWVVTWACCAPYRPQHHK